jgi:hypothetical protein
VCTARFGGGHPDLAKEARFSRQGGSLVEIREIGQTELDEFRGLLDEVEAGCMLRVVLNRGCTQAKGSG